MVNRFPHPPDSSKSRKEGGVASLILSGAADPPTLDLFDRTLATTGGYNTKGMRAPFEHEGRYSRTSIIRTLCPLHLSRQSG